MSNPATADPVEKKYPIPSLFALGLQHVLVMYAGAVAVPLIVGTALHLSKDQIAMLVSADLFCCGIVTMIQSLGFGRYVGIRLPIMMGISFTAVPTLIATGTNPDLGMPGVIGAVIGSGVSPFSPRPSSENGCASSRRSSPARSCWSSAFR